MHRDGGLRTSCEFVIKRGEMRMPAGDASIRRERVATPAGQDRERDLAILE